MIEHEGQEMGTPNPDYADLYTNKEDRLLKYAPLKDIVEEYLRYPTTMQRTHHIIYRGKRYEGEAVETLLNMSSDQGRPANSASRK